MKLIILDRDGTINHDRDDYVKSVDEWIPLDGALEAIAKLSQAGYTMVVATNQSGLGRGLYDMAALNAMHDKMHRLLRKVGGRVDAIFFCPHNPASGDAPCHCRKPRPGLFEKIRDRYGVDMTTVASVGDTLRDLQASVAVGCAPHLVRTGKSQHQTPEHLPEGTRIHADLMAFADWMIAHSTTHLAIHV
ncbi:MAG: D-glycero-beta-D-manno-heptose 1,7-bisphosphate 7-phosphatase [Cytophagales bacterium]|nr:D-glycero-beta-D-manno-heptose 1,7-bisphosphate 7-phosphatase [Cytophagales bacterium]